MSKLSLENATPQAYDKPRLQDIIRAICGQVNQLSEGRLAAKYNAQSSVPGSGSVSYAVGDFIPDSNATVTNGTIRLGWICTAAGTPGTFKEFRGMIADFGPITNSLSADVNLNNTSNYFDGPSVAQGTVGTWFVSGKVTCLDLAGPATFRAKLWDGTTIIDSTSRTDNANQTVFTLSGYITNPAGNLRISVRDSSSTNGVIQANGSGLGKDSTITAIRIG